MTTLFDYMKETTRLLRESKQELINPNDMITHINRARRDIAMRSQCVRLLTPISGSVSTISIVAYGSSYTGATVAITAPDSPSGVAPFPTGNQATATITLSGTSISTVSVTNGGSGYFQPTASIIGNGSGASVTLTVANINVLTTGQEVYPFSGIFLPTGYASVYWVQNIAMIYANYRYALPIYPFSMYQAYVRNYPFQYQYVPTFASQYGQGTSGSFYVYPLPSQTYQYELDCLCIPSDLATNTDTEVLPLPWNEAVPYLATCYGFMALQNYNVANYYKQWYDEFVQRYSNYARGTRMVNPYGRV